MVRFHWHVEDGCGASIPAGGMAFAPGSAVQHVSCSIEVPGEGPAQACITVPRGYLTPGAVKEAGVLLGHDDPVQWQGALLTGLAVALAEAGYVVVRYHSDGSELRKQRLYEKALDVCATSPFARFVQRWILAGVGHGARLAAVVGSRVRGTVSGYVLLSYPLAEPYTTAKSGSELPDSSAPLLRLAAPVLFVQGAAAAEGSKGKGGARGSSGKRGQAASAPAHEQLAKVAARMKPAAMPRLLSVAGADASLLSGQPPALQPQTLAAIKPGLLDFIAAATAGKPDSCSVPLAADGVSAAGEGGGGDAAAQVALLDEDDAAVYDLEPLGRPGEPAGGAAGGAASPSPAANGAGGMQAAAQQHLLQAVLQQQQAQLAAAAKANMTLQHAAAQRLMAAAAANGGGGANKGGAGGFAQVTPQMLAAAQAMQLAAATQGMRPGAGPQQLVLQGNMAAMAAAQAQAAAAQAAAGKK